MTQRYGFPFLLLPAEAKERIFPLIGLWEEKRRLALLLANGYIIRVPQPKKNEFLSLFYLRPLWV
jgi:hypothetical protein